MELNDKTLNAQKAFVTKLIDVRDKVANDEFEIDGTGDTLNAIVGMVVQSMGADAYEEARDAIEHATDEKAKVLALLNSVVKRFEDTVRISESTLSAAKSLGITGDHGSRLRAHRDHVHA